MSQIIAFIGGDECVHDVDERYINRMKVWARETLETHLHDQGRVVSFDYHGVIDRYERGMDDDTEDGIVRSKIQELNERGIHPLILSWVGMTGDKEAGLRRQVQDGVFDGATLVITKCPRNFNERVLKSKQRLVSALGISVHIDDGPDHLCLLDGEDPDSLEFQRVLFIRDIGEIERSKSRSKLFRKIAPFTKVETSWDSLLSSFS